MHDEDRLARGESRKACARTRDLVDETFAAGRPVAGGRFPEFPIGRAEFAFEFVVTPSGPGAKILFAKGGLLDRNESQPLSPRWRGWLDASAASRVRECYDQTCGLLAAAWLGARSLRG